jgi:hypothetical protein
MKHVLFFLGVLLAFGMIGLSTPSSESNLSLQALIKDIRAEVRPDEGMDYMRQLYSTDRWFTFPKFAQSAEYLKRTMTTMGLQQVEMPSAPADGASQFGYWTEPLAWDVKEARLEIIDPDLPAAERTLADYQKEPCSMCMWSGSTPPGGVTAEVADIKGYKVDAVAKLDLHGKLALIDMDPGDFNIKYALMKAGAVGAINAYSQSPDLLDGRTWINAWGDNGPGYGYIKGNSNLLCFSITPRQGALVRKLLAEKRTVRAKATVDSRHYEGRYPYATGVIPGTGNEEVLTLGPSALHGANDNATAVAAMLEAAATLNRLITSGKLARPQRTMRLLAMPTLYGSMHYVATNPERIRRTVAASNLTASFDPYNLSGPVFTFYMNPGVASSYVDAFTLKLADDYLSTAELGPGDSGRPWHWKSFARGMGADQILADPTIGVPNVYICSGNSVELYYNSLDTPKRVDPRSLRDLAVVDAAFLYYLANAGPSEARWLAELSENHGYDLILGSVDSYLDRLAAAQSPQELGKVMQEAKEKTDYLVERGTEAINSVQRLTPEADREALQSSLAPLVARLREFGDKQSLRVQSAVQARADALGITSPIEPVETPDAQEAVASTIVVKRLKVGTITNDEITPDQREGYPSGGGDTVAITALYWCDGHRTLAEVIHNTRMELGPTKLDFVGYFRFLRKRGYVEFVQGN